MNTSLFPSKPNKTKQLVSDLKTLRTLMLLVTFYFNTLNAAIFFLHMFNLCKCHGFDPTLRISRHESNLLTARWFAMSFFRNVAPMKIKGLSWQAAFIMSNTVSDKLKCIVLINIIGLLWWAAFIVSNTVSETALINSNV